MGWTRFGVAASCQKNCNTGQFSWSDWVAASSQLSCPNDLWSTFQKGVSDAHSQNCAEISSYTKLVHLFRLNRVPIYKPQTGLSGNMVELYLKIPWFIIMFPTPVQHFGVYYPFSDFSDVHIFIIHHYSEAKSSFFHGRNGHLCPIWPRITGIHLDRRQDHLVALAIAKKRRDDLKRKADEARDFFHFI